jgi:hypothetical protein
VRQAARHAARHADGIERVREGVQPAADERRLVFTRQARFDRRPLELCRAVLDDGASAYAANLTPDRNTGLGIWTEEMFVSAIRTGRHMGTSREILPPMPWPAFRNATDDDLKSIYAYLRTLTPVTNHVPDVQPPAATHTN